MTAPIMSRFAALPMYDPPELREATDALWAAIADRLSAGGLSLVPEKLTRDGDLAALWRRGGLLLGQTCGYPLMTQWAGRFTVVATPLYRAEGCEGPFHRSAIVVARGSTAGHLGDLRGARCAVNDWTSNTGMNLLRARVSPLAERGRFFGSVVASGSHRQSLTLIAEGAADVAAIDCVTLALLRRVAPELVAAVRILDWSAPSPALPLITALDTGPAVLELLRTALREIAAAPALAGVRETLLIDGFEQLPPDSYGAVLEFERVAAGRGYPAVA